MTMRAACIAVALLASASCGGSTARPVTPAPAPLTEESACARFCEGLRGCGGAPAGCDEACERDRARLKQGFTPSFVGCVLKELDVDMCTPPDEEKRAGAISLCYSATLNVLASRDAGKSARNVLSASCRHRARCAVDATIDEAECVSELEKSARAAVMVLAVAREELVDRVAKCIEASGCTETDPVPRCFSEIGAKGSESKEHP